MIRVQGLTKRFGAVTALDAVSFEINRGQIFALMGPNGAGKTITVKILTTLMAPTAGSVHIDSLDLLRQTAAVRSRLGVVFQDCSLDQDLSAFDNMEMHGVLYGMPRNTRRERIDKLLREFELEGRRKELVRTFSGGMKRRLEIARSLLHRPALLFLDEPTTGLDPQSRNRFWNQIREINASEGMTIFLTTHYLEEVERVASRVAVLDHGRIIASGTPAQLKVQTGKTSVEEAFLHLTGTAIRDYA
jgi:ABC-2 type transport system ATP-binding protein